MYTYIYIYSLHILNIRVYMYLLIYINKKRKELKPPYIITNLNLDCGTVVFNTNIVLAYDQTNGRQNP